MVAGEQRLELAPGMAVRVGAAQLRNFLTGDEPFQMLAIGGVPGEAYYAAAVHRARRRRSPPGALTNAGPGTALLSDLIALYREFAYKCADRRPVAAGRS